MKFGRLELNPAENPGVLDTATWDTSMAGQFLNDGFNWSDAKKAALAGGPLPAGKNVSLHGGSVAVANGSVHVLAGLPDKQDVFAVMGHSHTVPLSGCFGERPLPGGEAVRFYPSTASNIDQYTRKLLPAKAARPLGSTPRLGVGTRMTTSVWPGIFSAMNKSGFAANAIQNSVRELNLLDNLLKGAPPDRNYATGIGMVETGWTGSTYEGLWVAGVLAALKWNGPLDYGADADHVQVKRGADGVERAKKVLRAARYYSFYTLDMADILNYAALNETSVNVAEGFLKDKISDAVERKAVMETHCQPFRAGTQDIQLDAAAVGRFVGKYWDTLAVLEELARYIAALKEDPRFDLELTIDEHPPEVGAFDCLTTDQEVLFLCRELRRRGLPVTHLAPNFGQEKGCDYRCPDGLEGLERRARTQFQIASEFGLMLDVHSGDDLTSAPRRVFQKATNGEIHFKVSPQLQLLYAKDLQDYYPELFKGWFEDAVGFARREAANGSSIARQTLAELDASSDPSPSWRHSVFHYFSFPYVGKRGQDGQFVRRQEFYRLSQAFNEAHARRIDDYLTGIATDVFNSQS
jgi:hypothetical protein